MRRDNRIKNNENSKSILYIGLSVGTIVLLIIIALIFINTNTSQKEEESKLITSKVTDLVPNNNAVENTSKEASSSLGKNVTESEKSLNEQNSVNNTNSSVSNTNTANTTKNENTIANNTVSNNTNTNKTEETTTTTESNIEDEKKDVKEEKVEDPIFIKPVEGETLREYAKDKLVYSETLKEWVTHPGIDIKAEKTSVVKAAADGKVISIKNDPRYGLTVVIEHQNNFRTVYSNLLTAEFVTEGEEIKSGQTIGTVGNTAIFEISDEPHLHFEILKDNENVDPGIYVQQ